MRVFVFAIILVLGAGIVFMSQEGQEVKETEVTDRAFEDVPELSLSADVLEQADTLFLRMKEKPGSIFFNGESFGFFWLPQTKEWVSLIGISAKAEPGTYFLQVNFAEGVVMKENVFVKKRDFYETELVLTKEMEEEGYDAQTISQNVFQENLLISKAMNPYIPEPYFSGSFLPPLSETEVAGIYGNIRRREDVALQHLGVDLVSDLGTDVYSINNGIVSFARNLTNYGKTIIVNHGLGIYSLYLHLDELFAREGDKVGRGEVLGLSGNTGYSLAPHLHFSMKLKGASIDPLKFIESANKELY